MQPLTKTEEGFWRKQKVISDPVDRWKLGIGESTWKAYRDYWAKFLEVMEIADPKRLLKLSLLEAGDLAKEFHAFLKKQKYSSKSCALGYTVVRSFFNHNNMRLGKVARKFTGKTQYEQGYKMSQQEVYELIEAVPKWSNKFTTAICFQGGQRRGICTALRFRHIQTRNWENARVVVFDIPELLLDIKGKNVNKWEVKYRFALLDDAMRYLALHVHERERKGEVITPNSWLVRSTHSRNAVTPISGRRVNDAVVEAAERIRIQSYVTTAKGRRKAVIHAHIGRIYFKAQLRQAGVDPDLRNFMMGHKMPYAGAYDKFSEAEIVGAMESARRLLALAPKVLSQLEWEKQKWLRNAPNSLTQDELEQIGKIIKDSATNC